MPNHFLARASKTANLSSSHRRAPKQERAIADRLNARLVPASGAKDVKGDVRIKGVVRIEAKTTMNKSFSVTKDIIDKIETAAVASGEMPVIIVEFNDGNGRKLKEVAIMPMYALQTLIDGQR